MSKFRQLCNPHSHSASSLDGAATIEQIIDRNLELGSNYISATEHGNLNSAMELYHTCKKKNAHPILGIELYVESPFKDLLRERFESEIPQVSDPEDIAKRAEKIERKVRESYVHLTVHFKDEWAYNYFCKLTPIMEERAIVRWAERKPMATLTEVYGARGHITICSSCIVGLVSKWILPYKDTTRPDLAEKAYAMIRGIAGEDNFFVEIFPHQVTHNWKKPEVDPKTKIITPGQFIPIECSPVLPDGDIQKLANQFMLSMAKKYGDPVLISLDSHFATKAQRVIQEAKLGNGKEQWKFSNCFHILSTDECADEFKHTLGVSDRDIEEWVDNSYRFASLFDNFKIPTNKDRWILEKLDSNFMTTLKDAIDRHGRMNWSNQQMLDRLKREINDLAFNGTINLMSYMFTVEDMADFCRKNKILMNVRGSGGGSLLAYLLGVSAINPLEYDLSWERFITLGRIRAGNLPDLDIDVSSRGRDKLLGYLTEKYGDRMCQLSIDTQLKLRSSIRDAERAILGKVQPSTEAMCARSLPDEQQGVSSHDFVFGHTDSMGVKHLGVLETNSTLKKYSEDNPQIWETVKECLGIKRQTSVHACGVVIADKPVQEYCPITIVKGTRVTGFSPKSIELAGLVKYDILGLITLDDIELCLNSLEECSQDIERTTGKKLDWQNLPYDQKCFDAFGEGRTETIFQFDTDTVRPYLIGTKPKSISDLSNITALCRPGTLDAPNGDGRTLAEVYMSRKSGEAIAHIHPDMAPITGETMGVQLFQEQTIRIFKDLGGYSNEEAEAVRRGIGKKDEKVLSEATGKLRERCLQRGWTQQQVDLLIEQIMASSRYSFNKSHSASYGKLAYTCMYLKENYPLHWWKATLSNATKDELATKFWKYVKDFTDLPDINNSSEDYKIAGNRLISPISIVSGVGEKAYKQLVANAPYKDFRSYVEIHHKKSKKGSGDRSAVNAGVTRKLIAAGVLDSLFGEPNLTIEEKLYRFEKAKSEIRSEKIEPIPEEYVGITPLGKYLIKKELISIYSEDLRPLMMPYRGGKQESYGWSTQDHLPLVDGPTLADLKARCDQGTGEEGWYGVVAYVIDEKTQQYRNKTKQMTKMYIDVGGSFSEEILWPKFGEDISDSGYSGLPVMIVYNSERSRFYLKKVVPLIQEEQLKKYNMV